MRDLESALTDHELVVLRVIGEWWGLDLTGSQKLESAPDRNMGQEVLNFARRERHFCSTV